VDPDPTANYISGADVVARLMALTNASKANAWADNAVSSPCNGPLCYTRFNLDTASPAEIRQYADGQYVMATTTEYEEEASYTLNIVWSVYFEQPNTDIDVNQPRHYVFRPFTVFGTEYSWTVANAAESGDWFELFYGQGLPIFEHGYIPPDGDYTQPGPNQWGAFVKGGSKPDGVHLQIDQIRVQNEGSIIFLRISQLIPGGGKMELKGGDSCSLTTFYLINNAQLFLDIYASPYATGLNDVVIGHAHLSPALVKHVGDSHVKWAEHCKRQRSRSIKKEAARVVLTEYLRREMECLNLTDLQRVAECPLDGLVTPATF